MSPVGSRREAVFRVPLLRWCTRLRGPEVWWKEAMDQHIVIFEFVRETSFFELFSVFELLCMAGWLTVLWQSWTQVFMCHEWRVSDIFRNNTNYETTMRFPILVIVGENCTLVVKRSHNRGWYWSMYAARQSLQFWYDLCHVDSELFHHGCLFWSSHPLEEFTIKDMRLEILSHELSF